MRTLVLGVGNPILGDDGVGLEVARRLEERLEGVHVELACAIDLDFVDLTEGYDRVVVVDAMCTRGGRPGEVRKILPDQGPGTIHLFSSHGMHIFGILELAGRMGFKTPCRLEVYGVEIGEAVCFEERISPELLARMDAIVEAVADKITEHAAPRASEPEPRRAS